MPQLLDRFMDLNIRYDKMTKSEKEVRRLKNIKFIVDEVVAKLGENTDRFIDSFVATIACISIFEKKVTSEEYKKIETLTPFAKIPPYKKYKKSLITIQENTVDILKDFFHQVEKYKPQLDPKFMQICVEFLVTLNGNVDFLILYTKLFKRT